MSQDHTEYRSRLGQVAIANSHIERQRNDSSDWEILEKNFPDQLIADQVHFSNIEQVTYTEGSTYPYIQFEMEDAKKKMFFSIGDPYKEIFRQLKEKLAAYRQAYQ